MRQAKGEKTLSNRSDRHPSHQPVGALESAFVDGGLQTLRYSYYYCGMLASPYQPCAVDFLTKVVYRWETFNTHGPNIENIAVVVVPDLFKVRFSAPGAGTTSIDEIEPIAVDRWR